MSGKENTKSYYHKSEIPEHLLQYFEEIEPPVSPAIVYDPFLGSGTTLIVARRLERSGVGIELSYEYTQAARERLMEKKRSAWEKGESIIDSSDVSELPMFSIKEKEDENCMD